MFASAVCVFFYLYQEVLIRKAVTFGGENLTIHFYSLNTKRVLVEVLGLVFYLI